MTGVYETFSTIYKALFQKQSLAESQCLWQVYPLKDLGISTVLVQQQVIWIQWSSPRGDVDFHP